MDREAIERKERLDALLHSDDIYRAYADSAEELEEAFTRIAESLPPQQRQVLVGYRECRKLMELRAANLICEEMRFSS